MSWIRVTIKDTTRLKYPNICANCLKSPADTLTPLVRSVDGVFISRGKWPLCKRCSAWTTRASRLGWYFAVLPALCLIALAILFAFAPLPANTITHPMTMRLLLASFFIAVVGSAFFTTMQWWAVRPDSCISNFPVIKPLRGGVDLISLKNFAELEFKHPLYVEALIAVNDPENLKCDVHELHVVKDSFLKKLRKQVGDHSV